MRKKNNYFRIVLSICTLLTLTGCNETNKTLIETVNQNSIEISDEKLIESKMSENTNNEITNKIIKNNNIENESISDNKLEIENKNPDKIENVQEKTSEENTNENIINNKEPEIKIETVTVSTPKEFFNAIKPNTIIKLNKGIYNLSEYIEQAWKDEGEEWNRLYPYLQLRKDNDKLKITIQNVENLTITGISENIEETKIETTINDSILNFLNCKKLNISSLTIGNLENDIYEGTILSFDNCNDIKIDKTNLFCYSKYGIKINNTSELYVNNTEINKCLFGPLAIEDCTGKIEFKNCKFTDSNNGGYSNNNKETNILFEKCHFGEQESYVWKSYKNIVVKDCTWDEVKNIPKYNLTEEIIQKSNENLYPTIINEEILKEKLWTAHSMIDLNTGKILYLPFEDLKNQYFINVIAKFNNDNTGTLEYLNSYDNFTWECQSPYSAIVKVEDEILTHLSLYKNINDSNDMWIKIQIDKNIVWFNSKKTD